MAQLGRLLLALALAIGITAPSAMGFDVHDKHEEYGFSLDRPGSFEARPIPPDVSPDLLLMYAPKDAPIDRRAPVTHSIFKVDGATTVLAVQRWVLQTLQPSELEKVRAVRSRYGRRPVRYTGSFFDDDGVERSLFVHGWMGETGAILFIGECEPDRLRREKRVFDRVSMSFRFFTEAEIAKQRAKWERHYMRSRLKHVPERIDVASALVDGWQIRDTEHSVVLYHGASNSPTLAQIAENLVAIRQQLTVDFPPDRPIDALSIVRVCRDRGEYLTYGGNASTVGHFNPRTQELVLYDARTERSQAMPNDHPTMHTLYHEAVHQFLYHTASALSPHSWYDEGTAEFYSGAVLDRGRVTSVIGLPGRERYLREQLPKGTIPKLADLLSMTQAQFYASADVNYSTGYALVRFLKSSPVVQSRREWRTLHTRYFETLRKTWRLEAEGLALSGLNGSKYSASINRSRAKALEAALEGVDLDELEAAFLEWVRVGSDD